MELCSTHVYSVKKVEWITANFAAGGTISCMTHHNSLCIEKKKHLVTRTRQWVMWCYLLYAPTLVAWNKQSYFLNIKCVISNFKPCAIIWIKIFMLQIRIGANVFTCSRQRTKISLCTWWVSSFSRPPTSRETCNTQFQMLNLYSSALNMNHFTQKF